MSQAVDIHTLAGAYALDALTEIERAAFARHLAVCEACAAEVAGLTEAASRLALLDAQPPPPRLKEAVLNEVYRSRQLPADRALSGGRTRSAISPSRTRWLTAVAAALVGLAGIAGVWAVQESRVSHAREQAALLRDEQARITAVLTAGDAAVQSTATDVGGRIALVVSPSLGDAVVVLSGLPAPAADRAYQLWFIDDGEASSAAVLPAGAGSATALLHDMPRADTLGLTLEPAGGSTAPTTPVIADIDLT